MAGEPSPRRPVAKNLASATTASALRKVPSATKEYPCSTAWANAICQAGRATPSDADDEALPPALARLQAQTASWKGAELLYRQAVDAGYSASLIELARLREQHSDLRGAEALLRRAGDAARGSVVAPRPAG
ncbi:hypothetical protein ACFYUY_23575 [Kitasatospora sp. NPDC004745]|uniref:hypothetical protein n=1 Tax=Kitasatospora sp. NPDC004745 TaxID=3364019 RepID=UPI003683FCDA